MTSDRIAFFSPYFVPADRNRSLPSLMEFTVQSWAKNSIADFMIHTNCAEEMRSITEGCTNVKIIGCSYEEFFREIQKLYPPLNSELAVKKHPWFICHFKPLFGEMFSSLIEDYAFWGFLDWDVLLGDLSFFLTDDLLSENDIFLFEHAPAGPIMVLRNEKMTTNLWRSADDKDRLLMSLEDKPSFTEDTAGFPGAIKAANNLRIHATSFEDAWKIDFRWAEAIATGEMLRPWPHAFGRVVWDGSTLFTEADKKPRAALVLDLIGKYSTQNDFGTLPCAPILFKLPKLGVGSKAGLGCAKREEYLDQSPPLDDFLIPLTSDRK